MKTSSMVEKEQAHYPGANWEVATPESQGVDAQKLNEAMEYLKANTGKNGVSQVVVIRNGYIIWQGDDVENLHPVWSCTKSFTSTCLGLLWDDGKLSPSTLAKDILPVMAKDYPTVTLEHLGTFTSGYAHEKDDALAPVPSQYQPGEVFHYSKQSDLLAYALTMAGGETLSSLFRRRIGEPIGISEQDMQWGSLGVRDGFEINGGGGGPPAAVQITAKAMARFGWLYANNGKWKGQRLISQKYIDFASVPRVSPDLPPEDPNGWYVEMPLMGSYGLNWWVNGTIRGGVDTWPHAPKNTFAAQGNHNNICFVVRDWNMVIVRLGVDENISVTKHYDKMFELIGEGLLQK